MRLSPLVLSLLLACESAEKPVAETTAAAVAPGTPVTEEDKTFYALGLSMGSSIDVFQLKPAELEMVVAGLRDHVTGAAPKVELEVYGPKLGEMASAREGSAAAAEKEASAAFVKAAAAEPGAETLASGLVFLSITPGSGAHPTASDVVKVNYKGTLRDGTEFDSSARHGKPAIFPLSGVVPCWTEGIQKLTVGGKGKLTCPSDVAYGDRGRPPVIPGGAALQFEVELLEIMPAPPAGAFGH